MWYNIFMRACAIFYFICIVRHGAGKRVSYSGAQVWRTQLTNSKDAKTIISLVDKQAISLWNMNNQYVDYLIHADKQHKVNRELDKRRLSTSMLLEDVQLILDSQKLNKSKDTSSLRGGHPLDWKSFPKLRLIEEYLEYLATKLSERCTLTIIGHSVEKRAIHMLRISNGNPTNKAIIMTAGIHAREWIAIASALYLMDNFAMSFNQLPSYITSLDWFFIPVLNPDGYEYSHKKDRFWRKNRRKRPVNDTEPHCIGVDLNRNYGFSWKSNKKSACSDIHSGSQAFSEPETQAIRDLIKDSKPIAFIDVHTYGQIILYPWSSKPESPEHIDLLKSTASKMSQSIMQTTGQMYFHGDAYSILYPGYGVQTDWFYSMGVIHSYTLEMRDGSQGETRGFLLPASFIIPTGNDLIAAMYQLAEILNHSATNNKIDLQSPDDDDPDSRFGLGAIFDYAKKIFFGLISR